MQSFNQNVIKHKTGLLNLAAELGNISKACKIMGYSRDTFYRYQAAKETGGVEALFDANRRKPNLKNRVEEAIEQADRRADDTRAIQRPKEIIVVQELVKIIQKRLEYNRKRYPARAYDLGRELFQTLPDGTPFLDHQHKADGASHNGGNNHERHWDDDLLPVSTQEPTGRNRSPGGKVQQSKKSSETMGSKDMGLRTTQGRERTLHTAPQGNTDRLRTMESGQKERITPDTRWQIGENHDRNRALTKQNPHQDGTGIDHHAGQTYGNFANPQERPVAPQGTTSPYAEQTNVQNEQLQHLSTAYENLLPLLEKLNSILKIN